MPSVTVPLATPIPLFDTEPPITSIELKEPTGTQYLDFGEPRLLARNDDGTCFWFEDKAAIKAYLKVNIDHPHAAAVLTKLSVKDMRAVREALFGFFSDTPPNPSSGPVTAESTPSMSAS